MTAEKSRGALMDKNGPLPSLTFVGGAGTVTGSKTLLEVGDQKLLVDCGLFQGRKKLRLQNWDPFPVDPASIDAVLLTHAHIDHCGYLPRLVRLGFDGPVYCTEGTKELAAIVLPDSGYLQEEEADYANRRGYSKHQPALPLYTKEEAITSLDHLVAVDFDEPVPVTSGVSATWNHAGHILGAASLDLHLRSVFPWCQKKAGSQGTNGIIAINLRLRRRLSETSNR